MFNGTDVASELANIFFCIGRYTLWATKQFLLLVGLFFFLNKVTYAAVAFPPKQNTHHENLDGHQPKRFDDQRSFSTAL